MRSGKFDPTPPGCWHSFQGPSCHAMQNASKMPSKSKPQNTASGFHAQNRRARKSSLVHETFFETCLDNSKRLRMTKTSNERAVFTDMDRRTHLGASKANAKKPTLASEISEAPHHVQKMSPDELSRSLQSPNFPQNRPSKPPK